MIGPAITALLFVGFLITGIYVTNISDSYVVQDQTPSIGEDFFADLESVAGAGKNMQEVEEMNSNPNQSKTTASSFLDFLRQKQKKTAVRPSSIFSGGTVATPSSGPYGSPSINIETSMQSGGFSTATSSGGSGQSSSNTGTGGGGTTSTSTSGSYWFPSTNTGTSTQSSGGGSRSSGSTGSSTGSSTNPYVPSIPPATSATQPSSSSQTQQGSSSSSSQSTSQDDSILQALQDLDLDNLFGDDDFFSDDDDDFGSDIEP